MSEGVERVSLIGKESIRLTIWVQSALAKSLMEIWVGGSGVLKRENWTRSGRWSEESVMIMWSGMEKPPLSG